MYNQLDKYDEQALEEIIDGVLADSSAVDEESVGDALFFKLVEFINDKLSYAYSNGHEDGTDDGHSDGWDEGYTQGWDEGYAEAEYECDDSEF